VVSVKNYEKDLLNIGITNLEEQQKVLDSLYKLVILIQRNYNEYEKR